MAQTKLTPREILNQYANLLVSNANYEALSQEEQDEVSDGLLYAVGDIEAQSGEVGQLLLDLLGQDAR